MAQERKPVATVELEGLHERPSTWLPKSRSGYWQLMLAWLEQAEPGQTFTVSITKPEEA